MLRLLAGAHMQFSIMGFFFIQSVNGVTDSLTDGSLAHDDTNVPACFPSLPRVIALNVIMLSFFVYTLMP